MDACLNLISAKLPPIGLSAHAVMRRYLESCVDESELEATRIACWRYIDANIKNKYDFSDPLLCGVRAVICGLWPVRDVGDEDFIDCVGTFLDFVHRVEPHYDEEILLLREKFPI